MQVICVADSAERGWELAGPGLEYFVNFYETRKNLQGEPAPERTRHRRDDSQRQRRLLARGGGHARRRDHLHWPRSRKAPSDGSPSLHARSGIRACATKRRIGRCGCSTSTCSPRCARSLRKADRAGSGAAHTSIDRTFATTSARTRCGFVANASARSGDAMYSASAPSKSPSCATAHTNFGVHVIGVGEHDPEPVLRSRLDDGTPPRDEVVHTTGFDRVAAQLNRRPGHEPRRRPWRRSRAPSGTSDQRQPSGTHHRARRSRDRHRDGSRRGRDRRACR